MKTTFWRSLIMGAAAAVIGLAPKTASAQTLTLYTGENQGWYRQDGLHYAGNPNYATGRYSTPRAAGDYRSFFSFDLGGLNLTGKRITGATFHVQRAGQNGPVNLGLYEVGAATSALTADHAAGDAGGQALYADLGSGTSYGSYAVGTGGTADILSFSLNTAALNGIANRAGAGFFTLGAATTGDNMLFTYSRELVNQQLELTLEDTPRISAAAVAPEPASFAMILPGLAPLGFLFRRRRRGA